MDRGRRRYLWLDRLKRGDIVTVAAAGDYGKPRPALVMQSNAFANLPSVTVLPLTSTILDVPAIRVAITPAPSNGLKVQSHIMVDKVLTIPRARVGRGIGSVDADTLAVVSQALRTFLMLD